MLLSKCSEFHSHHPQTITPQPQMSNVNKARFCVMRYSARCHGACHNDVWFGVHRLCCPHDRDHLGCQNQFNDVTQHPHSWWIQRICCWRLSPVGVRTPSSFLRPPRHRRWFGSWNCERCCLWRIHQRKRQRFNTGGIGSCSHRFYLRNWQTLYYRISFLLTSSYSVVF